MRKTSLAFGIGFALLAASCGNADDPYKPAPAWSGRKPNLPAPPSLTNAPIKSGDAYTIYGASHQLRSRIHDKEVTSKSITITGYIVEENISSAPSCAIHKAGKQDPETCTTDIPSFWIADEKGAGKDKPRVRVLGWAKNFASVFEAIDKTKKLKEVKDPEKDLYKDEQWQVIVPYPLPGVGAKVKVTGKYGFTFAKSTTGIVSDPVYGVMTYEKIEYVEPPADAVAFKNAPSAGK